MMNGMLESATAIQKRAFDLLTKNFDHDRYGLGPTSVLHGQCVFPAVAPVTVFDDSSGSLASVL